jgi:hypothetical protein
MKRSLHLDLPTLCLLVGSLLLPGCRFADNPIVPGRATPTLRTIWPNDDGHYWAYRMVGRNLYGGSIRTYPAADSVPPAPSLAEIERLIEGRGAGAGYNPDTATFRLQFSGTMTTESGMTGQNLTETIVAPTFAGRLSAPASTAFLAQLMRARPELRSRLAARLPRATFEAGSEFGRRPLFLFGYAWVRNAEWIGTYGDVDTLPAWKYLTARLSPGSEFTHPLVPSLAHDIFLHGRILTPRNVATPAGVYRQATVCLYLVDYGVSAGRDEQGNPTGYFREYSYGTVTCVDRVGPVASYEQDMLCAGVDGPGYQELDLALTSTGPGNAAWALRRR